MQSLMEKYRTVILSRFGWGKLFWTGADRVVLPIDSCDIGS